MKSTDIQFIQLILLHDFIIMSQKRLFGVVKIGFVVQLLLALVFSCFIFANDIYDSSRTAWSEPCVLSTKLHTIDLTILTVPT